MTVAMDKTGTPLTDIIDKIVADAHDGALTLGDVLDDLGDRSYGPLFFVLGLLIITPLAAVPGIPALVGLVLIILAVQFVFGLHHPWMPQRFRHLSIPAVKAVEAAGKLRPVLRFFDRFVDSRAGFMVSRPMRIFAATAIIIMALTTIPLELVPFGTNLPGAAIASFGLAIIARDGLIMFGALGFVGGTGWLVTQLWAFFIQ